MMVLRLDSLAVLLALACGGAAATEVPPAANPMKPSTLNLQPGQVEVVRVRASVNKLHVGAPDVADVRRLKGDQVAITAKRAGLSTVVFLTEANDPLGAIDVVVGASHSDSWPVRVSAGGVTKAYRCSSAGCYPDELGF